MAIAKWGSEFLVNTIETTGYQWESSVYALAGGGYGVAWTDQNSGAPGVRFQRYAGDGSAIGSASLLPVESFLFTSDPVIAGLQDGRFVVAYSASQTPYSATPRAVLYNQDGSFNQTLFELDQNGDQDTMSIVSLSGGGVAISWVDHNTGGASDVRFRVFDPAYAASGIINVQASDIAQDDPSMAALTDGRFVVTWTEYDGTADTLRAEIFNANGTVAVAGFDVVAATENDQGYTSVSGLTGGGFVVTWWDGGDLRGQVYNAAGATVGSRFDVYASGGNDPSVAALTNGGFVIVFNTYDGGLGDTSQSAVRGQVFNASGAKVDAEFLVNTTTTGDQSDAHVAGLPDGRFVVTWTDTSHAGADTSNTAVYGQIFDPRTSAVTLAGSVLADDLVGTNFADTLSGADSADRLDGRGGNDTLNGGLGADTLIGDLGNDTFYVDNLGDVTFEAANAGTDTVVASRSWAVASNIEKVVLTGTGDFNVAGNGLANTLRGNSGDNWINGSFGKDILTGLGGRDSFIFNRTLGPNNVDTITDYDVVRDVIRIDNAVFAGIGAAGALSANQFHIGAAAADSDDHIIYNSVDGKLYFDIDGTGATAQVQFATLTGAPTGMAATEFIII